MKKKATSSSSERSSFQSLKEAKDFVDQCFDKLIDLYTSGYNASEIYGGYLVLKDESEDRRSSRKELRKELQDKATEDLLSLGPQLLQICSDLCLLDPFGESRELFYLLSDQIELWSIRKRSSLGYWDFRERAESERKRIVDGLPGFLAYQNSLEQSKPKKSRKPEAIRKGEDLLYLLDQYESWKAKTAQETGRKKLNPKDWYKNFATWTQTSKKLFDEYAKSGLGDDNSDIVSIIKYAQKIKRERSKGGE